VRLEGLGKLKNPMTSLGIEPVTFWLCLNLHQQVCSKIFGIKVYTNVPPTNQNKEE
jgi:hypothetical protein